MGPVEVPERSQTAIKVGFHFKYIPLSMTSLFYLACVNTGTQNKLSKYHKMFNLGDWNKVVEKLPTNRGML